MSDHNDVRRVRIEEQENYQEDAEYAADGIDEIILDDPNGTHYLVEQEAWERVDDGEWPLERRRLKERIEDLENNKDAWKAEAIKRAGGEGYAVKKEWCKKCGGTKHIQEQDDRGKYLCATGGMPIILDCPDCAVRKEQGDE